MGSTRERIGRPTQFHGVPLEERAVDAQGNRLPWALEWAEWVELIALEIPLLNKLTVVITQMHDIRSVSQRRRDPLVNPHDEEVHHELREPKRPPRKRSSI